MLDTKAVAEVLGTTVARVRRAVKELALEWSVGPKNRAYFNSDDIDKIKAHLGL